MSELNRTWDMLWKDYTSFNPHAKRIYDEILEREKASNPSITALVNDHVAFRTFRAPKIGLESLAQIFTALGYELKKDYHFEQKKLYAKHYEHLHDPEMPKVFISELLTEEFSPKVQEAVAYVNDQVPAELLTQPSFLWSGRSWKASYKTYKELLAESEYAGWMYAFGFRPNHFTISFNHLKTFNTLGDLNDFVQSKGHELNSSGGLIKGSTKDHLEQSSTLAGKVQVEFEEGTFEIPACYYEFARRYPQSDGNLYTGFVAQSADKIFESTDTQRT
ncbi:MAG TPA: DUF1338 domain-containing protein [Bdellovibrionales bacterium]|nr:succinyldiaminopimelate aminotransferase [Thioclava sp.]HAG90381.1 DUF1338 domain-containing protein [Bdellovibrionales bacterium]|tara:strand:- start:338 stop:1165 length:828 start_codon:yes stop_codon:yes gene_type:complete